MNQASVNYEDAPFGKFHKKLLRGGVMGQFCDGYLIGSIAIPMSLAIPDMDMTPFVSGLVGASSLLGVTCGSLTSGKIADFWGRRWLYSNIMIFALLFCLLQFFVSTPTQFWLARFAIGFCVGTDYAISLTVLNEWNPAKQKTFSLAMVMLAWFTGYVASYMVGFIFIACDYRAWRTILCTCAIPLAMAAYLRHGSPETPKWLAAKHGGELANDIVQKYIGASFAVFFPDAGNGPSVGKASIFARGIIKNTLVGGIFYACQCFPYYAITIFLPLILQKLDISSPYLGGIMFNIFLLCGAPLGCWLITRLPRRAFLFVSFYLCAFYFIILYLFPSMNSLLLLLCISLFAFCISAAMVLETVYPPELFHTVSRGAGVGFCVACGSIGSISGAFLLPIVMENYGLEAVNLLCGAVLLAGGIICQLFAPETSRGN